MKTVQQIYSEYRIMPNLQLHQLRVAAVAKMIAAHFKGPLDKDAMILACLFHDMGNIIKSDLAYFPEFLKPEGLEYWQKVKNDFVQKYGTDETVASHRIMQEISLSSQTQDRLKNIGFRNAIKNDATGIFEDKICNYSDMRVGPHGVLSMDERLADGRKRYADRIHSIVSMDFDLSAKALKHMEEEIFSKTDIRPEDLTDEKIASVIEEFRALVLKEV